MRKSKEERKWETESMIESKLESGRRREQDRKLEIEREEESKIESGR